MTSRLFVFCLCFCLALTPFINNRALAEENDALFRVARLKYSGGGDWYSNPSSLHNLLRELRKRTTVQTARREAVVSLKDDRIFHYPFIYMTGHGNVRFNAEERQRLSLYLASGGFLWADDNYGMDASFRRELKATFPKSPLVELPIDHPIYSTVYPFPKGLPKIHVHHGGAPKGLGLFLNGRLVVFYTYNTDIGDGLEDPDVHRDSLEKREAAMKMAINVVTYVLTH